MAEGTDRFNVDRVPDELLPRAQREALSEGLTHESLMELLRRVEEQPYGPFGAAPDDWFEGARHEGETRSGAKSRIMLKEYSRQGFGIKDHDLWQLRAAYARVYQFVQSDGRPYSTHNWQHFYNRYGADGRRIPVYMIGLRVDTVEEMGRMSMIESQSLWAMRLLGHHLPRY